MHERQFIDMYNSDMLQQYILLLLSKKEYYHHTNFWGVWKVFRLVPGTVDMSFYFKVIKQSYNSHRMKEFLLKEAITIVYNSYLQEARQNLHMKRFLSNIATNQSLQNNTVLQHMILTILDSELQPNFSF